MTALFIVLIILGFILLAIEMLVIPGFGVAGVLGCASLIGACIFAFIGFGTLIGCIVVVSVVALVIIGIFFLLKTNTWKKLSLKTNIESKVDDSPENKGLKVGDKGMTVTRLAPSGHVNFNSVIVEVTTREGLIGPKKEVSIVAFEGNRIFVAAINNE